MKFEFETICKLPTTELRETQNKLGTYIAHLNNVSATNNFASQESSINLPFDETSIAEIMAVKTQMVTEKLKYIVVIGIGGANLGSKAIYDAVYGHYDILQIKNQPKMLFMDTINPLFRSNLLNLIESKIISPDEILFIGLSKSGTTLETRDNLEFLESKIKFFSSRLIIATEENTPFWKKYTEQKVKCLKIYSSVGDRYSVFSVNGLLPLACAGYNVVEILEGAMEVRKNCLLTTDKNIATLAAAIAYNNYKNGKTNHITFIFHPELESLGKWHNQLVAESLGKDGKGILPVNSIGTVDLHSMAQLYLSGPQDKYTEFVYSQELNKNKNLKAILEGVKVAYTKRNIPFTEFILDDLSPKSIAQYMQTKMIEIMCLGNLLDVNAFDQPNVEEYKVETNKLLLPHKND